jgi:hypothetical protein
LPEGKRPRRINLLHITVLLQEKLENENAFDRNLSMARTSSPPIRELLRNLTPPPFFKHTAGPAD